MNLEEMNDLELLEFTIVRHSFIRDFNLFSNKDEEESFYIIRQVIKHVPFETLINEIRVAHKGAIQYDNRHTHYFNQYVIGYFINHFKCISEIRNDERIKVESDQEITNNEFKLDYEWVMENDFLEEITLCEEITLYERQLLYEHYVLGHTFQYLAKKFEITERTVINDLNKIKFKMRAYRLYHFFA